MLTKRILNLFAKGHGEGVVDIPASNEHVGNLVSAVDGSMEHRDYATLQAIPA